MDKEKKSYIYALSAVLLWSTVASAFKLALREVNVIQLLFYSTIVSTITLFILVLFQRKLHLVLSQTKGDIFKSALLGFLNPFFYYIILFRAYDLLPAQEAQPLNYTWAIVLAILSIPILKQKLSIKAFIAIFISFIGVLVISTKGNITSLKFTNTEGVLFAVGSSLVWAVYWLFSVRDKRDVTVKLLTGFIFGSIYISITALATGNIILPNIKGILSTSYIGVFEMGITFFLWLKAMNLSERSGVLGNFIYLSPFISFIFIHFIVGEDIHISSVLGLLLIITGVILQQRTGKIKKEMKEER
jgi:drug/metabolite transporter (DMT)-like permease